ncbi:MAG: OmpH family outer membrane protein [Bacteroidales bacterium]|nr:OmpH family outer membrane protein [Bacteroidales bacterium]
MEENRKMDKPIENVVPDEMMPGFSAAESQKKAENEAKDTVEQLDSEPHMNGASEDGQNRNSCEKKKKCCHIGHLIFDLLLLAAVIALFILHFTGNKERKVDTVATSDKAGNGSVVYVNIDTVNEQYEMVALLTDSIDAEKQRQTVLFQNRQKTLESKLANYQRNIQSGQLTAQQAQYAEASLQQESQKLQNDYQQAVESLEARYAAALEQIADSLRAATARVNARHNASYVFTYGAGSPMISADPTMDITKEVVEELNKPFKSKRKK